MGFGSDSSIVNLLYFGILIWCSGGTIFFLFLEKDYNKTAIRFLKGSQNEGAQTLAWRVVTPLRCYNNIETTQRGHSIPGQGL